MLWMIYGDDFTRDRSPSQRNSILMKMKNYRNKFQTSILALALATGMSQAGADETTTMTTAPADDVVSGVLKLDYNSHFISYGADVWNDGASLSDPTFNPMLELAFALPSNFTFTLGSWMDVNNKVDSAIGGSLQEVDVWAGLAYTYEKLTVSATYQSWMYANDDEKILDVKFAYDCLLAPSLTIHHRLDQGAAAGNEGTILVLGVSHSIETGPVTFSFPVNVAYFLDGDFHGGSDEGVGYASVGAQAAVPLAPVIDEAFGDWTLNAGATYYFTDDEIIPNNDEKDLLTANVGLALSF